ncbi:YggT family protein [Candidatus Saccharibacteria bacterium]|nr:YggT family protein [Candidatus Saccharibacteria bacterium]NCU40974.1 YggT family protein [Candidatus Saccharibacteria bacterium]
MVANIIYAIGGFIELLVGLRFILRLLGADAGNAIVNWVYSWSTPFVAPFSGMFGVDATVVSGIGTATTSVFDWTALVALVVIGLVVGFVGSLLGRRR